MHGDLCFRCRSVEGVHYGTIKGKVCEEFIPSPIPWFELFELSPLEQTFIRRRLRDDK